VGKAAGMTRRLLAFSRQQVMQPTVLLLNDVVTDLCKMLPQLLGEDIDLMLELEEQLHNVNADRGQLEQVLMNLAVNARDAMPDGGKLTIATSNVELDSAYPLRKGLEIAPGKYVVLAVTDTGTGMDQATQAKIFEPFFTTKEPGKGTGLGLASVYGIVKQSGGFIWVYSEIGKGTTFKVYLPIVGAEIETHAEQPVEASVGGDETILLVEDEAMLRRMMADYLHSRGYDVIEASNGADALEKWNSRGSDIQLLITDVVMPGIGGPQLLEFLRAKKPDLRVIYISGYADRTSDSEPIPSHAYLQKPFSLEVLARKIRSVLTAENS
jgi:CheY-like chemotaxis protein